MSTSQFTLEVAPGGVTAIVPLENGLNSPCEVIVQNINNNGITCYIGNSKMWDTENWGIKLLDGMSMSIALGSNDELYALADDYINITVLKTTGHRR